MEEKLNKRIITALLLSAIFTLTFCSCGDSAKNNTNTDTVTQISVEELAHSITSQCEFPEMYELSADELYGEFGVDNTQVSEFYAAVPTEYPGIERIFLATVSADSDTNQVASALDKAFKTIKAEYIDYIPEEYTKAVDAEIITKNDFISLVICGNSTLANKIINDYVK